MIHTPLYTTHAYTVHTLPIYTACHEIGLDVVGDTVHIPTDLETPLYITVTDVQNGIEIANVANTHVINMLAILQERLGMAATFIPQNESPTPSRTIQICTTEMLKIILISCSS